MSVFERLFRFYINASVHVALGVVSLYVLSTKNLNGPLNENLLGFLFFSTIVCYNFVKYGVEAEKYLIVSKPSHKPIQFFSFLAFGFSLFFLFQLQVKLWWFIIFFTAVSGLYAVPFLPRSKNLRSLGGLKMFLIAFIWVGFTLVLPIVDYGIEIDFDIMVKLARRFLLVLILIIPFEIRDLKYDNPELGTIPQRFGVSTTKKIGYFLISVYFVLNLVGKGTEAPKVVFTLISVLLLCSVIYLTKEKQSRYYASFWVDGLPMALLLLTIGLEWTMD